MSQCACTRCYLCEAENAKLRGRLDAGIALAEEVNDTSIRAQARVAELEAALREIAGWCECRELCDCTHGMIETARRALDPKAGA